jgi:hypothetical protein
VSISSSGDCEVHAGPVFARSKAESVVQTAAPASNRNTSCSDLTKKIISTAHGSRRKAQSSPTEIEFPLRRPSKAPIAERCSQARVRSAALTRALACCAVFGWVASLRRAAPTETQLAGLT